jgi:xanthine dehydrogenase accessory factor
MPDGLWLDAVVRLRAAREPAVLVTLATVRGHAPRRAGAKMVVSATGVWGSIGGGNVEATAIERARARLKNPTATGPELMTFELSERALSEHGAQCCGGVVTVLLDPLPTVPAVAIFGVGNVGLELARILARHDLELHLIDTRPEMLSESRLAALADAVATLHVHKVPVLPESVFGELPSGTHVLIMTHDHAEDAALCDAALRERDLGSIGLIGSSGKWARFRRRLAEEGGHDAQTIARIRTPIGLPDISGKEPATIAVGVAADLLRTFEREAEPEREPELELEHEGDGARS